MSFEQIVINAGYLFEEHTVTTDDGYILKVFRIRNPERVKSPAGAILL